MTRRIVFAGGVQAKALAKAYRLDVAERRDEDVFFIGVESIAREAAHRVIAAADVVVTEMGEQGDTVPDSLVPGRAVLVGLPIVCADFLWPFAGRPHPANRPSEALPDGPYPADFGDSHLDALLARFMPPEAAVQAYLEADLAELVDLDGMLAARLRVQAALDARAGTDLAPLIEERFRGGTLFASRHRLHLDLFRHMAADMFTRMGADSAMAHALTETHFPAGEMPIHPSVLRHFGMTAPAPDYRYPVLDEGEFAFDEYCQRYVRGTWNKALHEALALAEISPQDAIPALRQVLQEQPGSNAVRAALARAERAVSGLSLHPPSVDDVVPEKVTVKPPGDGAETLPALSTATIPATLLPSAAAMVEQHVYVELPLAYHGHEQPEAADTPPSPPGRYTPMPPADDRLEMLPFMLSGMRGTAGADDGPFATMAEIMPPPPLRPVLPPEIPAEPARRGLLAKLFGGRG